MRLRRGREILKLNLNNRIGLEVELEYKFWRGNKQHKIENAKSASGKTSSFNLI